MVNSGDGMGCWEITLCFALWKTIKIDKWLKTQTFSNNLGTLVVMRIDDLCWCAIIRNEKTFIVTRQLFWSNDWFDRDIFRQQMALNSSRILTLIQSDYFWSATYKPPAFIMFLKAFVITIPAHLCVLKIHTHNIQNT